MGEEGQRKMAQSIIAIILRVIGAAGKVIVRRQRLRRLGGPPERPRTVGAGLFNHAFGICRLIYGFDVSWPMFVIKVAVAVAVCHLSPI